MFMASFQENLMILWKQTLRKICQNTVFLWPVCFRIFPFLRTDYSVLIREHANQENMYSGILYAERIPWCYQMVSCPYSDKRILRETQIWKFLYKLLIYEFPTVICASLGYPRLPLFNLCILTLIMVKLFGLVQEKNPTRKQAHHLYEFLWS